MISQRSKPHSHPSLCAAFDQDLVDAGIWSETFRLRRMRMATPNGAIKIAVEMSATDGAETDLMRLQAFESSSPRDRQKGDDVGENSYLNARDCGKL